ncbi:hypothetical protein GCM10009733_019170 [Nonomuraea maheshkhaliensis]|uniref:Uncharacterized protein n=2 Tax=Nonomuraea maheshkhaliensis TaxID=419590 RepID=A0ABP4QW42_9ACTN
MFLVRLVRCDGGFGIEVPAFAALGLAELLVALGTRRALAVEGGPARDVELDQLPINERKAALLLDTARAFLMWNHHDKALNILRAAGEIAPEEITGRPAALRLVRDILATAPICVRREAREYAATLGVIA